MSRDDLIYLAGFFDGEGSIGLYTSGTKAVYLKIQLVQNESPETIALMDELCAEYGGNISVAKSLSGKNKMNWQISSHRALVFLKTIAPFLRGKREQALLAISWAEGKDFSVKRDANGRITRKPVDPNDALIAKKLKEMKK